MHREPSRPPLLIILSLIVMLAVLVLGCAPCCSWWGSGFGLNGGGGATVSGTAYITIGGQQTPVPKVAVTLGVSASTTAKYSTTTNSDGYFELKNVVPGTYFIRIAGGDLGWTDSITVKKDASLNLGNIQLHPTLPPPNTDTKQYPATPEDVIRAYYKAINEGDYNKALSFIAGQLSAVTLDTLQAQYEPYVKNIKVVSIERRASMDYNGRSIYFVTFTAEYIKHYEAGSEDLQRTHSLQQIDGKWMIVDIGTG